jgi:8-oxo-dGTP pyrophosphatase MutT (NUDIX family)
LIRRFCTGYGDGCYAFPGGRLDGAETVTRAAIREAHEEIGIILQPEDLTMLHVVHVSRSPISPESIGFLMKASVWGGEPINREPHKHDELRWFARDQLPENILPTHRHFFNMVERGIFYSEFGWD